MKNLLKVGISAFVITAVLAACGGGTAEAPPSPSAGQVVPAAAAAKVSFYAASRFAEQASFGPTPALVAELQAKGFEKWIDEQMALPFVGIDIKPAEAIYVYGNNDKIPQEIHTYFDREIVRLSLAGPDPLRLRVMWSLSSFVVGARTKGEMPGHVNWANLLYRQAFGKYSDLLRGATLDRHMAHYLDNDQNRPKSTECPNCAPNENYARELMQLFTIGVIKLNPDGSAQRDSRGRFIETYTQRDVEELARALTGWTTDQNPPTRPQRNWGNWGKPMVPSTWPPERDAGKKLVMGRTFAAGQTVAKDLDDIVDMLMTHPNIAPFVSQRLIQQLVKSDPSPAYIERVAAKFRNNGSGVAGDLKAVVKTLLLDPEARRGDNPSNARAEDGKFKEPWLHRVGAFRGLNCTTNPKSADGNYWSAYNQQAFRPDSVFGYYAPSDRAPGSNLLAPEQRLLNSNELTTRLGELNWMRWNSVTQVQDSSQLRNAGCEVDALISAYSQSPKAYLDLVSARYFRGAMPPTLRSNIEQLIRQPQWNANDPSEGAMRMLAFALSTPYYGVSK